MIDRVSPTLRPNGIPVGYQQWRSLLFMHWPTTVQLLRPLVPKSMELDLYAGVPYVGLVPFAMHQVRPRWAPRSLSFDFLETNVRTYVTYKRRPGVYFFSLDAASRIGVWIARQFWGLPYFNADMSLRQAGDNIHYHSVRRGTDYCLDVTCRIGATLAPSTPDSIEFFFLERYLLFLERNRKILEGQVHHTPYPVHDAEVIEMQADLVSAIGLNCETELPRFVHYSPGVDVEVYGLHPA